MSNKLFRCTRDTLAALTVFGAFIAPQAVQAQGFPNKPIKIIVGFPAGGPLDQHAAGAPRGG